MDFDTVKIIRCSEPCLMKMLFSRMRATTTPTVAPLLYVTPRFRAARDILGAMIGRNWPRSKFLFLAAAIASTSPSAADNVHGARPPLVLQGETSDKRVRDSHNQEQKHLKMGWRYVDSADYQKAIECFTKVIELNPTNEEAYLMREDVYLITRQFDKAFDDDCAAIKLARDYPFSYLHRTPGY